MFPSIRTNCDMDPLVEIFRQNQKVQYPRLKVRLTSFSVRFEPSTIYHQHIKLKNGQATCNQHGIITIQICFYFVLRLEVNRQREVVIAVIWGFGIRSV